MAARCTAIMGIRVIHPMSVDDLEDLINALLWMIYPGHLKLTPWPPVCAARPPLTTAPPLPPVIAFLAILITKSLGNAHARTSQLESNVIRGILPYNVEIQWAKGHIMDHLMLWNIWVSSDGSTEEDV